MGIPVEESGGLVDQEELSNLTRDRPRPSGSEQHSRTRAWEEEKATNI